MPRLALCLVLQEISGGGGPVDPGYGIPGIPGYAPGGPGIDNTLPGGMPAHPWFPGHLGGGRPDNSLPGGRPPHVGNWVPGQGLPPHPSLPIYHPDKPTPPGTSPGAGIWVIAYVPGKGLEWVAVSPGVPEKPMPEPEPEPEPK
jgi:hypothetical protein